MGACSVEPKWEEGRKKQNQLNYPRKKNLPGACSAELMIARHNSIPPACPSSSPPARVYVRTPMALLSSPLLWMPVLAS